MADVILNPILVGTFPSGITYNSLNALFTDAYARTSLTLPSASVIWGQLGGVQPTSQLPGNGSTPGLWFNNNTFYQWNSDSAAYLPLPIVTGQLVNGTMRNCQIQCGNLTSNTILTTPVDRSGVIALLSDIQGGGGSGTITLSGTSVTVNCSLKQSAYLVMSGNSTINLSGLSDGQVQYVIVENASGASDWTVSWSLQIVSGILAWPGGTAPTQSVHQTSKRIIDVYKFVQCGTTTLGNRDMTDLRISGTGTGGSDNTPPTVASVVGQGGTFNIFITFSELLGAFAIPPSDFTVKKNNVVQTVSSATCIGSIVTLTVGASLKANATWTAQYVGTEIKDIAGNSAANFGPLAVTVTSAGGGEGGGANTVV